MKHPLIAATTILALAFAGPSGAHAGKKARRGHSYHPKVSLEDARTVALERVPGTVLDEELEKEDGRWIYTFDIRPQTRTKKILKEVHVDPDTGKILAVESERDRSTAK